MAEGRWAAGAQADDDDLLDCARAATYLGVQVTTVRRLLRQGRLPGRQERGDWRIRRADCDAWLAARRGGFAPAPPAPPEKP